MTITAAEAAALPAQVAAGDSVLTVHTGLVLDEYQALQALLLASADNIADVLAVFDAGTIAAFVTKMNSAAAALGMTHTNYADASGLDPASSSTPTDLLRLARAAMTDQLFAGIVGERTASIDGVGPITNYNSLAGTAGFNGIKTGSTDPAGGCLLFSVTRPVAGHAYTFYGVVLGQRGGAYIAAALAAAKVLADSAYVQIRQQTVVRAGQPIVAVTRADRHEILVAPAPLTLTGLPGDAVSLQLAPAGPHDYTLVARDAGSTATAELVAPRLAPPSLGWRVNRILP